MHYLLLAIFLAHMYSQVDTETVSDHIVFSIRGSSLQARQLAEDHNLIYVSEVYFKPKTHFCHFCFMIPHCSVYQRVQVFPGSQLHHAILRNEVPFSSQYGEYVDRDKRAWITLNRLSSDPRVSLTFNHDTSSICCFVFFIVQIDTIDRQVYYPRELRDLTSTTVSAYEKTIINSSSTEMPFNDPLYPQQWYLVRLTNARTFGIHLLFLLSCSTAMVWMITI